jgi:SAM-dependent methyltransferase
MKMDIDNKDIHEYYKTLDKNMRQNATSNNDEPTPLECVEEMWDLAFKFIPEKFWKQAKVILDPCCGNGNFHLVLYYKLKKILSKQKIMAKLYFNDINHQYINTVQKIFGKCNTSINDFLTAEFPLCDLIVANPPYAKIQASGVRTSKNHNLVKDFLNKALQLLKPNGYILFITPDNWMSLADRNTIISTLTSLQVLYLDIHCAKKYFKKVGSSFTWYLVQNCPAYTTINTRGIWHNKIYEDTVQSMTRSYIPLFYNSIVQSILSKTIDADNEKFKVQTSSDLHKYTKKSLISTTNDIDHPYRLIHTPLQTVYASRPHKYQEGYKVFISLTDKYKVFVDNCGMTQSIAFILCSSKKQAEEYAQILQHPLYVFLNNICRWGNFNNVRILQKFPYTNNNIFEHFKITPIEQACIDKNL